MNGFAEALDKMGEMSGLGSFAPLFFFSVVVVGAVGTGAYIVTTARSKERQHFAQLVDDLNSVKERLNEAEKIGNFGSFVWDFENPQASFWSEEMYILCGLVPHKKAPGIEALIAKTHADDKNKATREWDKAVHQPGPFSFVFRSVAPSGEVRVIKIQGTTALAVDKSPRVIQGYARDITKEVEVDRSKSEFVSFASHQLKTPLTSARWLSEALLSGSAGTLSPTQRAYVSKIEGASERMIRMVNDLLDVSRIELGTFAAGADQCDVCAIAKSVTEEQRPVAAAKKVALTLSCPPEIPTMHADANLLRMILQNLISNSIKYTPSTGSVECELTLTGAPQERVFIRVADTGIGIPKEEQGRVFERLHRASNAQLTEPDGTGLGLYIVKLIVERAGGMITFESAEHKGSVFTVSLPLIWHRATDIPSPGHATMQPL